MDGGWTVAELLLYEQVDAAASVTRKLRYHPLQSCASSERVLGCGRVPDQGCDHAHGFPETVSLLICLRSVRSRPCLRRTAQDGAHVKIQDLPLRLMGLLAERPGEVVTREELQSRLWPQNTFVDFEDGLNTGVKKLREALGDDPEKPRYIETIPRRGYRFIAKVTQMSAPARVAVSSEESPASPAVPEPAAAIGASGSRWKRGYWER